MLQSTGSQKSQTRLSDWTKLTQWALPPALEHTDPRPFSPTTTVFGYKSGDYTTQKTKVHKENAWCWTGRQTNMHAPTHIGLLIHSTNVFWIPLCTRQHNNLEVKVHQLGTIIIVDVLLEQMRKKSPGIFYNSGLSLLQGCQL